MERYFSIKELAALSGVKSHTIRMWEKRYNLLEPERTGTNIRIYNDYQLRKLINVTALLDQGIKISKIAGMDISEIETHREHLINSGPASDASLIHIEEFVRSMQEMDEDKFEEVFASCAIRYGLKDTFVEIIYPFLKRVGMMWCCDKILPAHEHFITSLIKQKLFTAADQCKITGETDQTWVLALPHQEYHEIGLLLAHVIVKNAGQRSFYLGQDVPFANLKPTVSTTNATHFLVILIKKDHEKTHTYLRELEKELSQVKIFVAVAAGEIEEELYPKITFLHDINHLEEHL